MPEQIDNSDYHDLDPTTVRELDLLCARLFDNIISTEELSRLKLLLEKNQAARALYLRHVGLNLAMTASAESEVHSLEGILGEEDIASVSEVSESLKGSTSRKSFARNVLSFPASSTRSHVMRTAAAVLLLALTIGLLWISNRVDRDSVVGQLPEQAKQTPAPPTSESGFADAPQLRYVSPTVRWNNRNEAFLERAAVPIGNVLAMSEGEVELVYATGTKLLLVGPAEFLVQPAGGKLIRGGLLASVTESGHGFTIETPNGRIVDLGTEFGVAVDDFGVSEVSVFQGKVEAFPHSADSTKDMIELTKGRGMQWNEFGVTPLDANLRRFASAVLDRKQNVRQIDAQSPQITEFEGQSLDSTVWRALGEVQATPEGLWMSGNRTEADLPYLISAEQFDPAEGTVTVTCDFRFLDVDPSSPMSFSILTRSTDNRGTAPPPWAATLAKCVRCTFDAEPTSGSGRLQTGVKLATNREVTNVSWSGFRGPTTGRPYRLVMQDDGVNVSFTISLRDEPSTTKTVRCRTLFRGGTNYIALEGSNRGTVVVDRVEISQEPPAQPLSSYADISELIVESHRQRELELKLLAELVPSGAELILQDDFEGNALNEERWAILGDVQLQSGAVQLGLLSSEGQIDTHKQRPYLLTSNPIDMSSGDIAILGRMSFADNFLSDYGASFAVMTRSDHDWGHDPAQGWANFLLQRGIRANFWPASWDTTHSLEIHELTGPNHIELLTTQKVNVDPKVRSYLFRLLDDGRSVSFTMIDPNQPDSPMTISSSTTYVRNEGCVGFESTWGSPVTLDDIRIYRMSKTDGNPK